jgi:hypothetical protein
LRLFQDANETLIFDSISYNALSHFIYWKNEMGGQEALANKRSFIKCVFFLLLTKAAYPNSKHFSNIENNLEILLLMNLSNSKTELLSLSQIWPV